MALSNVINGALGKQLYSDLLLDWLCQAKHKIRTGKHCRDVRKACRSDCVCFDDGFVQQQAAKRPSTRHRRAQQDCRSCSGARTSVFFLRASCTEQTRQEFSKQLLSSRVWCRSATSSGFGYFDKCLFDRKVHPNSWNLRWKSTKFWRLD